MATISRSGITTAQPIQATHITNIIDALDGTSTTTTVVATGSFKGNLVGSASWATNASSISFPNINSLPASLNGGTGYSGISSIQQLVVQGYTASVDLTVGRFNYCDTSGLSGDMQIQLDLGVNNGDEYTFFWLTGSRSIQFTSGSPSVTIVSENDYKRMYTSGSVVTAKFLGTVQYGMATSTVWVLIGSLKA